MEKSWAWWYTLVILVTAGSLKLEDHSSHWLGQKAKPKAKITRAKRARSMAIQHPPIS
jgi:hypothetical protein